MTDDTTDWESLLGDFECEDCHKSILDCVCDTEEYAFDEEEL